jgi:hypothetical protein
MLCLPAGPTAYQQSSHHPRWPNFGPCLALWCCAGNLKFSDTAALPPYVTFSDTAALPPYVKFSDTAAFPHTLTPQLSSLCDMLPPLLPSGPTALPPCVSICAPICYPLLLSLVPLPSFADVNTLILMWRSMFNSRKCWLRCKLRRLPLRKGQVPGLLTYTLV